MSHIKSLLCLLIATGLTILPVTVHAELAAQWNFDDPNDPGQDTSGNDFHLTLVGDANGLEGILQLDGEGDKAVGEDWPVLDFNDPNGAFTVSMLAKFNDLPDGPVALVSKWGGGGNNGWWLGQTLAGHLLIQLSENGNASEGIELLTTDPLDPNTWYYIAYRVDPNNDTFEIFVDGQPMAADHVLETTDINDIFASTAILEVGGTDTTLNGCLDEINIFSSSLSDEEIWANKPTVVSAMGIEPNAINITSNGNWVTGFLVLPEDCNDIEIDPNSVLLEGVIPAVRSWIDTNECLLMAKFDRAELVALTGTGDIELTMSARLASGVWLEGTDTVRIFNPQLNKILVNYKAQQLVIKGGSKADIGEDLDIAKFGLMNQSSVDDTGDVKIAFYLSVDPNIIPDEDIYLGEEIVPGLAAHAHYTGSTSVTIPAIAPGEYYLGSYVDPDDSIAESKENDNSHVKDEPLTVE